MKAMSIEFVRLVVQLSVNLSMLGSCTIVLGFPYDDVFLSYLTSNH